MHFCTCIQTRYEAEITELSNVKNKDKNNKYGIYIMLTLQGETSKVKYILVAEMTAAHVVNQCTSHSPPNCTAHQHWHANRVSRQTRHSISFYYYTVSHCTGISSQNC